MQSRTRDAPGLLSLIAALVAGVFVVDLVTPMGISIWVLYTAPLVLCLRSLQPRLPLLVGAISSFLSLIVYFRLSSSDVLISEYAPLNRGLLIVTLAILSLFARQVIKARLSLLQQDWVKQGINELNGAIRGTQGLETLGNNILSFLARYLDAAIGSLYVLDDAGSLARCGGYAIGSSSGGAGSVVALGETLIGQAAADARVILVEELPEGYLEVRSGVGRAKPSCLLIAPAISDDTVNAVLELGFFKRLTPADFALLEALTQPIGAAIRSSRSQARQAELLEETQRQAEELLIQQQELRATNEELEGQSQALRASQTRLEAQHHELEETNVNLAEQARILEAQKEALTTTQELLQQKASVIERSSRYKSEFLANMSHELRTPLNSALILARLLADNKTGNLSPEQVQYATNIYAAGNDLLVLINDILDLAKIEAGKVELSIEPVELKLLLDELDQRFAPMAAQKGLSLSFTVEEGCAPSIETDPRRLRQILTNLLSNAIKFTHSGSISLVTAQTPGGGLAIAVEDTGIGIPRNQHEVIFEAFRQADGTTNRKYGGTGLGLSISRELAILLGGDIHLESAPMEGSRFTLTLPAHPDPGPQARSAAAAPPAAPPSTRDETDADPKAPRRSVQDDRGSLDQTSRVVLAIEDDEVFATILRDLAHDLHFQCIIAQDAEDGLQLARRYNPVAIILDLGLPDHSGLTVLDLLKRSPQTRHVPIHVVSAHDYQQIAREMGAIGYVLKPVKREELEGAFKRLEKHLERKVRQLLILEDDEVQRRAICDLLHEDGVEITAAATADEAFARLQEKTFDCMVIDLMLPGTSGFDLLARMDKEDAPHPPVIIYTARALSAEEERRLRHHAKSIIVKGARSPERLLEEVTLFLHQVEAELPPEKRHMLQTARERDGLFEGRRILVVEDDIRNVFAFTSTLEPKGAVVEVARNGREAIERIRQEPPIDLVLMDVMMPEMDGLSATRELRKDPRWSSLPIIALTAKAMPNDRKECLDAGANDYIAKPVEIDNLLSMIRVWMPR